MTKNARRTRASGDLVRRSDLVDYFSAAARPDPATHVVGTELEKFGVVAAPEGQPLLPVEFDAHIRPVFDALVDRFGWHPGGDRGDHGEVVMLQRDRASITLEPGGQLELSGEPLPDVHRTCAEFTQHYEELHAVSEPLGLSWFTAGFHPWATRAEINWMPKGRYRVMREYLPTRGRRALDMMLRTCTVQGNFDFTDEAQCGHRLRLASSFAPVLAAMFANSPYAEGEATGLQTERSAVWEHVDPDRCGVPAFIFDGEFAFERYVDWALDVPMFFVKRDGRYHPHHAPFRRFLAEGFRDETGVLHRATWGDWELHLSTVFPEIRLKPHIEVRSADAVGSRFVCALPALLKGILYDDDCAGQALEALGKQDAAQRAQLWTDARTRGLHAPGVHALARTLCRLARAGLERSAVLDSRGRTEARFLDPLDEIVEAGRSPGDVALAELGPTPGRDADAQHLFVRAFYFAGTQPGS